MLFRTIFLILALLVFYTSAVFGESRVFLLEVYDQIDKKQWEVVTGFSPDEYILTHGGGNRISVLVKATWHCYGDTSGYQTPCAMPTPQKPLFKKGDRVQVVLDKHVTDAWEGVIELALYRKIFNTNVYGVRFGENKKLYNRYFEFNLMKSSKAPEESPEKQAETAQ